MKQKFELNERLEKEKKNLEDLNELELGKLKEDFEERRSKQIAEHKQLVRFEILCRITYGLPCRFIST